MEIGGGDTVLEVEEGEDGGMMRVQTLGLTVRGLWDAMVRQGRLVEGMWEIWDEFDKYVGDGMIAEEDDDEREVA